MQHQRLSASNLFQQQRDYYSHRGIDAWRTGEVPFGLTTSPIMGRSYADMVEGYLRDLQAGQQLKEDQPLYIVELGAGIGRLGFNILKELENRPLPGRVCYVLSDLAESGPEFWRQHPALKPFLENGTLDMAIFDADKDEEVRLLESGARLNPENPVVFIANYLYDTLAQDGFRIQGGELYESLGRVVEEEGRYRLDYRYEPVSEPPYEEPVLNALLEEYRAQLGDTHLLLPVGGIACTRRLLELSGERMLLLVGDKGGDTLVDWSRGRAHQPSWHGAGFSMDVNFHALKRVLTDMGARPLWSEARKGGLMLWAFQFGEGDSSHLDYAFKRAADDFNPGDLWNFRCCLEGEIPEPSLRLLLEAMRLSCWDPQLVHVHSDQLCRLGAQADRGARAELHRALARSWERNFLLRHGTDLAFEIGRILSHIDMPEQGLEFYQESVRIFGKFSSTLCNMGVCYHTLRRLPEALRAFEEALELDPTMDAARDWILNLKTEMQESGSFCAVD